MAKQKQNDDKKKRGPNILITGTPGTGKTTLVTALSEETEINAVDLNLIIKTKKFYEGKDEERDCLIVDEDALMDYVEQTFIDNPNGSVGNVFDSHLCACFDAKWFDLVVVLRCDNTTLFDRLSERKYSKEKVSENVEAEIMQIILDEAVQTFGKQIVIELNNNNNEQMEQNIDDLKKWIATFANDDKANDKK